MNRQSHELLPNPLGAFAVLAAAAFLEAFGDSFFQAAFYRCFRMGMSARGLCRWRTIALAYLAYGSMVNLPRWDFGRLLGVYVALFFCGGNQF